MKLAHVVWPVWSLVPVVALAVHFGPGQLALNEEQAISATAKADDLEAVAQAAQDAAHAAHLAWITARRSASDSGDPADARAARDAADAADRAYAEASKAWQAAADQYQTAQTIWEDLDTTRATAMRIARNRAVIRAGEITTGVRDLESWLAEATEHGEGDTELARWARAEIAAGYYYGARLMRQAGKPTEEWTTVASLARQNFRYLAEGQTDQARAELEQEQKNLELALNLEHAADDLQWTPRPRNSPQQGNTEGLDNRPGGRGVSRRPPGNQDGRGAGGEDGIPAGW